MGGAPNSQYSETTHSAMVMYANAVHMVTFKGISTFTFRGMFVFTLWGISAFSLRGIWPLIAVATVYVRRKLRGILFGLRLRILACGFRVQA